MAASSPPPAFFSNGIAPSRSIFSCAGSTSMSMPHPFDRFHPCPTSDAVKGNQKISVTVRKTAAKGKQRRLNLISCVLKSIWITVSEISRAIKFGSQSHKFVKINHKFRSIEFLTLLSYVHSVSVLPQQGRGGHVLSSASTEYDSPHRSSFTNIRVDSMGGAHSAAGMEHPFLSSDRKRKLLGWKGSGRMKKQE